MRKFDSRLRSNGRNCLLYSSFCGRQLDHDTSAVWMQIISSDIAGMLPDNAIANAQPKSGALTRAFSSKEGIEYAVQISNPRTVVTKAQHNFSILHRTLYSNS